MRVLGVVAGAAILWGFFVGILLVVFVPVELHTMADARTWPSRPGIISESVASPVYSRRRGKIWTYVIRGKFTDTGEPFVLERVRYGEVWAGRGEARSRAVVARYPPGREIPVYYSPKHPKRLLLEPFAPTDQLRSALALGFMLLALPAALYAGRLFVYRFVSPRSIGLRSTSTMRP